MSRIIFHVDMNSFFAACELAEHPEFRGKPLVVSGNSRRGVITTASYEARALGIHAAMPLSEARRIYPRVIVMPVNHERYKAYSQSMMKILQRFSPKVEQASIDEAYLDMSHLIQRGQSYIEVAQCIQQTLQQELALGSSVGISYNRFLAKMASDMQKPNGLTILRRADVETKIWPLAIESMYGVGPKTAEKLRALGIKTIGELANYTDLLALKGLLGDKQATWLHQRACGNGNHQIDMTAKDELDSIGHSRTFSSDTIEERELEKQLEKLSRLVLQRLVKQQVVAKTLQVTIRNHRFETVTRSLSVPSYFKTEEEIFLAAMNVFWEHWDGNPVRLLGVTLQNLQPKKYVYEQLRLF